MSLVSRCSQLGGLAQGQLPIRADESRPLAASAIPLPPKPARSHALACVCPALRGLSLPHHALNLWADAGNGLPSSASISEKVNLTVCPRTLSSFARSGS